MSDKIRAQHLTRKAMLYVRQSSAYQVSHNLESQKLQYAMQDRLHQLGWNEIEVIDEDLGRSAAGTQTRTGFERMVAEVCLGHVGAVAAREVSRFARNSREWQQLVEVCRIVDTVLIDQETVYAPRQSNDRLLLGLKGSLNEYELDLLRQRSLEARREKAKRGELVVVAPVGYCKTEDQRLEKDPDLRVQDAIRSVFRQFGAIGASDVVMVPGARPAVAGMHAARRNPMETSELRHGVPDSDQPDLRWRVCLWQDRTHDQLRRRRTAQT
jgi:DNA invertase Pin-like site-specific DNA recombinase